MTDGRTDGQTDGRTDGGDCNIPYAFLKKRGDNNKTDNHYLVKTPQGFSPISFCGGKTPRGFSPAGFFLFCLKGFK